MNIRKLALPLCAVTAVLAVGCYEFVSQTTVLSTARPWTGSAAHTYSGNHGVVGLAGQDIYWFNTATPTFFNDPLLDEFGGAYELTSAAQTHTYGLHEQTFVHGNLVGETDNLSLLYTEQGNFFSMDWVDSWYASPKLTDYYGNMLSIVEICDMAAPADGSYGDPSDANSQLFLSVRTCAGIFGCHAGILEVSIDGSHQYWWPEYRGGDYQAWAHMPGITAWYSDECMPIAVTAGGDQTTQYLVVGDPSEDEFSIFDASSIASGPVDTLQVSEPNRKIADITVEGRADGSTEYVFVATLWKGSAGTKLEHRHLVNGAFTGDPPFLVESLPSNINFIATRGIGAESSTGDLFTFGSQVMRRNYAQ